MSSSADDILFSNIQGSPSTSSTITVAAHLYNFITRDVFENEDLEWEEDVSGEMVVLWNGTDYHAIVESDGAIEDFNYRYEHRQTFLEWRSYEDDLRPVVRRMDSDDLIFHSKKGNIFFLMGDDLGNPPVERIPDLIAFLESQR